MSRSSTGIRLIQYKRFFSAGGGPPRGGRLLASLLAGTVALVPATVHAQEQQPAADDQDTLLDRITLAGRAAPRALRLGPGLVPFVWDTDAGAELSLRWRWLDGPPPGQAVAEWQRERSAADEFALTVQRLGTWAAARAPPRQRLVRADPLEPDSAGARPPRGQIDILPGAIADFADLELQVEGTGQMAATWQNFEPCLLGLGQRCNSGAVPRIRPEFQLKAVARGTISERVHVDVDFDQTREFDATNNLNVFYRGKADEIVEVVELGDVRLPLGRSQFISRGIPAGNFGFRSQLRFGGLKLNAVVASQKGSVEAREVVLDAASLAGRSQTVLEDQTVTLDDAAYQTGQFFFLVDPRTIAGYPFVDILSLTGAEVPDSLRPASAVKIYRNTIVGGSQQQNVQTGTIQAEAVAVRHPTDDPAVPDSAVFRGFFRPMLDGQDYIVHRSGLWGVVRSTIQTQEALAVTYIAVSGDTVGDFDAEARFRELANTGSGALPVLELLKDPATHRPGGVTWRREMHHVYRIDSSDDVQQGSIRLTISQGPVESGPIVREADGVNFTFMQIFGLDEQPRDEQLDGVRVWRPANSGEFSGSSVVTGAYLVFSAVEPFQQPPIFSDTRTPSLSGSPFPLSAGDLNTRIYEEPNDVTRRTSSLYRLNFEYRASSSSGGGSLSLGAIGIRDGSERVLLNGRELTRGQDYSIDYDIGQLVLLRREDLLAGSTDPRLEVTFEQKPLFDLGQKNILALTGEYGLGDWGHLGFTGLSQTEGTVLTRPDLGLEPSGMKLLGFTADGALDVSALDAFVNALPGINTDIPSSVEFVGEVATSFPTTNRFGVTFVDDFEGGTGNSIALSNRAWRYGSAPSRPDADGMQDFLPDILDATNQLSQVWQSQWSDATNPNVVQGRLLTEQVDPALRVQAGTSETVLWLSVSDPPTAGSGWASITQSLSETGIDLSNTEFLEFYASTAGDQSASLALLIDIGTVSEDAFVRDSLGLPSGLGFLDQEADPATGIWGNLDDTGLWGRDCTAQPTVSAYPLGDERANCARNNGLEDTEDLSRDGFLDTDERFFRYVVPLTQPSRFLERATTGEFQFNLYRIPLLDPDLREALTNQGLQNAKHIRITVTANAPALVLVSRLEFSGSEYLKRGGTGSADGFVGAAPAAGGQAGVGPVSTADAGFVSPPGILDLQADRTDDFRITGQSFNEQALDVTFADIPAGSRAEVFRRFSERPRNFLRYRRMRAWALPIEGDWGPAGDLRLELRLGQDENNFYLYRTPLGLPDPTPQADSWRPEILVDFDRWIALRAAAETMILDDASLLSGDSALVVWDTDVFADGDSTMAVVITDRSRAPNLAAVRELAVAVSSTGAAASFTGRVWIDDIRLDQAADDRGTAGLGQLTVRAADIITLEADYRRRDPFYRQLGQQPSFLSTWNLNTAASLQFGRFLPASLGLAVPVRYSRRESNEDPFFLPETDILSDGVGRLRTGKSQLEQVSVSLLRAGRSGNAIVRSTLDGLRLGYTRTTSSRTTTQTSIEGQAWSGSVTWSRQVTDHSVRVVPSFLRSVIDVLPDFISQSSLLKNLKDLRFRWTPTGLGAGTVVTRATDTTRRFQSSLIGDSTGLVPTLNRNFTLRPSANVSVQPFPSLTGDFRVSSSRDLRRPAVVGTGAAGRRLIESQTGSFLGVFAGWETNQSIASRIEYRPVLFSWLTSQASVDSEYSSSRGVSYIQEVDGDTTLVRDMVLQRNLRMDLTLDPSRFLSSLGVAPADQAGGLAGGVRSVWDRIMPVRFAWSRVVNASFDRRAIQPVFTDRFVTASFDRLRVAGADTASSAGRDTRFSLDGGYRLPAGLETALRYSRTKNEVESTLTTRTTEDTEWPSVQVTWRRIPVPGFMDVVVQSWSLTAGYRERTRSALTTTGQNLVENQTGRSLSAQFIFDNGFNISYRFEDTDKERTDATGLSESSRGSHDVRATGTFAAPSAWRFLRAPLRLALEFSRNDNFDCRELGGAGLSAALLGATATDCTPFIDQTTQTASAALDTDFSGYSLGIQLSWVRRGSEVGTQQKSDQYNFEIFGRFFFRPDPTQFVPPSR
ncbi:MAG: cell surface protein SprA [Gemmatimonadota bacterium]